jgi:zona occludens toxin (predicted ATPase)
MVPFAGEAIDFGSDITLTLTASDALVFETSLPAGAVEALTNGSFKYRNAAAKLSGGMYKLRAKPTQDGTYKVSMTAYGNVGPAATDMVTHITVGGREWTVHALWRQTSSGWVFVGAIDTAP